MLEVYGFLMTLAGVVLGSMFRELGERRRRGQLLVLNLREFVGQLVRSVDLLRGMAAAPLAYAAVAGSGDSTGLGGTTFTALLLGFSCELVAARVLAGVGVQPVGAGAAPRGTRGESDTGHDNPLATAPNQASKGAGMHPVLGASGPLSQGGAG